MIEKRRRLATAVLLPWCLGLSGCLGTARIYKQPANLATKFDQRPSPNQSGENLTSVKGIPFFVKKPFCTLETVRLHRWLEVKLTLSEEGDSGEKSKVLADLGPVRVALDEPELTNLRTAIDKARANPTSQDVQDIEDAFKKLEAKRLDPDKPVDRLDTVSVNRSVRFQADTSTVYYYNGRMPWFGSSSVETNLADDGTMTKSNASSESKAADLIASVLPLKEFLAYRWIPTARAVAPKVDAQAFVNLGIDLSTSDAEALSKLFERECPTPAPAAAPLITELSIEPEAYTFTTSTTWLQKGLDDSSCGHCKEVPGNPPFDPMEVMPSQADCLLSIRRTLISEGKPDKSDGAERTVQFSGGVVLPEAKPAKP